MLYFVWNAPRPVHQPGQFEKGEIADRSHGGQCAVIYGFFEVGVAGTGDAAGIDVGGETSMGRPARLKSAGAAPVTDMPGLLEGTWEVMGGV